MNDIKISIEKFQDLKDKTIKCIEKGVPSEIEDKKKIYYELNVIREKLIEFNNTLIERLSKINFDSDILIQILMNYIKETSELVDCLFKRAQELYSEYNHDRLPLEEE